VGGDALAGSRLASRALQYLGAHASRIGVLREGMRSVAPAVIERWFTPAFRIAQADKVKRIERMLEATPAEGYAAACGAIAEMNQLAGIGRIVAPTLVICGSEDPATPVEHSTALCDAISGAHLAMLTAAHLSNIESPEEFSAAVCGFLTAPSRLP
jgi:3-oxoadipate enol-lactonase